jgi:oligoribonuclease
MLGIFLDSETNGLNAQKHKLLEVAYKIVDVRTGALLQEFEAVIFQTPETWKLSDPASLEVNGFTYDRVSAGKQSTEVAAQIKENFQKLGIKRGSAVFICQNPSFDRAFFSQLIDADTQEKLQWPYHWLDLASMYWGEAMRLGRMNPARLPWETGFSKDRIAATYHLPPEAKPHRALNGVNHLLLCYKAVIGFQ